MKKIIVIVLILQLLLTSLVASTTLNEQYPKTTHKGTLYVGGSGPGNYTKIQDAVDDASNGDTIYVYSGTYEERIYINKSISLIGEDKYNTKIKMDKPLFDGSSIIQINSNGILISGFMIINGSDGIRIGDFGHSPLNNVTITNNVITKCGSSAIQLYYSEYCIITSNIINDTVNVGITVSYSFFNEIKYNEIKNTNTGIDVSVWSENNEIIYNNITSCEEGIKLTRCSNNVISENDFEDNIIGIVFMDIPFSNIITNNRFSQSGFVVYTGTYDNVVENNTINGEEIFYMENTSDVTIENISVAQMVLLACINLTVKNCEITGGVIGIQLVVCFNSYIIDNTIVNSVQGIWIDSCESVTIVNNTVEHSKINGIVIKTSFDSTIAKNTLRNNGLDPYYVWFYWFFIEYEVTSGIMLVGSSKTTITENIVEENLVNGIILIGSLSNTITNNIIANNNNTGIMLIGTALNKIENNNFFDNTVDADFYLGILNKWRGNYWSEPRNLPKIINGKLTFKLSWINIDWRPAQEPYEIGGFL